MSLCPIFFFFCEDNSILCYVMRNKNEVLCAAAGRMAAERSEADKPAKAHKIIFARITYRASHVRFISEFILYATKNTNYADNLIPFIMCFNLVINVGM
jgi:hypothetical protein